MTKRAKVELGLVQDFAFRFGFSTLVTVLRLMGHHSEGEVSYLRKAPEEAQLIYALFEILCFGCAKEFVSLAGAAVIRKRVPDEASIKKFLLDHKQDLKRFRVPPVPSPNFGDVVSFLVEKEAV